MSRRCLTGHGVITVGIPGDVEWRGGRVLLGRLLTGELGERDFEDLKLLISHQKAKHFKCDECGRRLNTAGGTHSTPPLLQGPPTNPPPRSLRPLEPSPQGDPLPSRERPPEPVWPRRRDLRHGGHPAGGPRAAPQPHHPELLPGAGGPARRDGKPAAGEPGGGEPPEEDQVRDGGGAQG